MNCGFSVIYVTCLRWIWYIKITRSGVYASWSKYFAELGSVFVPEERFWKLCNWVGRENSKFFPIAQCLFLWSSIGRFTDFLSRSDRLQDGMGHFRLMSQSSLSSSLLLCFTVLIIALLLRKFVACKEKEV